MKNFLEKVSRSRILVVGDVMLDEYISGSVNRISPEAPVAVVAVSGRRSIPGGAANVAANIRSLGGSVILAGVVGADEAARRLRASLSAAGLDPNYLTEDTGRITTVKTRVTAHGQQIVRFDEEMADALPPSTQADLRGICVDGLRSVDACIISDYAKGVAGAGFCRWFIDEALKQNKPVLVDPKSSDLSRYRGASVVTPNLKEAATAAGCPIHTTAELESASVRLLENLGTSALLVTRGGDGMSLFEQGVSPWHLAAATTEVSDVTGAGDTVIAVLALALAVGYTMRQAARVANIAAGLAVRHAGTWAIQPGELSEAAV